MRTQHYFISLLVIAFVIGCSDGDIDPKVAALKTKQIELRAELDRLSSELEQVDNELEILVPTKENYKVTAYTVVKKRLEHFVRVQGAIKTDGNVLLTPTIGGEIIGMFVSEGAYVNKGTILAQIDAKSIQERIRDIKSSLELAEITFQKQKSLWDKKIGSEIQYLEAKNSTDRLKANLAEMEAELKKSMITAPFDGVIDEIITKRGEIASQSSPIFRFISLTKLYVEADVPESYITKIKKGDKVKLVSASNDTIDVSISVVAKYIDPDNRAFRIRIDVNSSNNSKFLPNQFAYILIQDYNNENAIQIPVSLVQQGSEGGNYLYVVATDNGKSIARKNIVITGIEAGGMVEILSGVNIGDLVVNRGGRNIKDGQELNVVKE